MAGQEGVPVDRIVALALTPWHAWTACTAYLIAAVLYPGWWA